MIIEMTQIIEKLNIYNNKDIFEKLDKNKELRDWFLVELNACLQRSESVVANLKDKKELRCYKNAVTSLEVENQKQKEVIDRLNFIKNRKNQGASQENINKMAIEFVNSYLKEVSE